MRLDNNEGKKILTAKDPQGRLLFSGPIESKEELDKVPKEVRDRFDKLQQKDLPSVSSPEGNDNDEPEDRDEGENDRSSVEQVAVPQSLSHSIWTIRTLLA